MFFYVFQLKEYKAKAKYVHGVDVAGEISNNSKGNISSNFSPDKPFEVVEPTKKQYLYSRTCLPNLKTKAKLVAAFLL